MNKLKLKLFKGVSLKGYMAVRVGNFFSKRVINAWNPLPDVVVSSCSVASFKR